MIRSGHTWAQYATVCSVDGPLTQCVPFTWKSQHTSKCDVKTSSLIFSAAGDVFVTIPVEDTRNQALLFPSDNCFDLRIERGA